MICQCLIIVSLHYVVSARHLNCAKHMGRNSSVIQW